MSQKLSLEILIKTIADARGITVTNEQVATLAQEMAAAAEGGEQLETSSQQIAERLESMAKASADATGATKRAAGATTDAAEAAQQLIDKATAGDRAQRKFNESLARADAAALRDVSEELRKLIESTERAGGNADILRRRLADVEAAGRSARSTIDRTTSSVRGAGRANLDAAGTLNKLGEATERGAAAGRVLGEIARGNIGYVAQLGSSLKALGAIIRANWIGALLVALTALWNFLPGLLERFGILKKKTKDVGDEAGAAATQVSRFVSIDTRFTRLEESLDAIRSKFEQTTAAVNALRSATDAIEDAKLGLALAQIDRREAETLSDLSLSDAERQRVKTQFAGEREEARQTAAESRATAQRQRAQEAVRLGESQLEASAAERVRLAQAEAEAQAALELVIEEANRLNRFIASFGDPLWQNDETKKLVAGAKEELDAVMKDIDAGKASLKKARDASAKAKERDESILQNTAAARQAAIAAEINEQSVRERGQAVRTRITTERQAAERAVATETAERELAGLMESAKVLAAAASQLGQAAQNRFVPEVATPSLMDAPEKRAAHVASVEERNTVRREAIAGAVQAIDSVASKVGDGADEREDLEALLAAVNRLAVAVPQSQREGLEQLRRQIRETEARISNVESQLRNGAR